MPALNEVPVAPASPERFRALIGEGYADVEQAIRRAEELLAGRVIWHLNSTARGGGVAEMLQSLLAYARGAGVDVRWLTIAGNEEFFRITKRIHNNLHGAGGDSGPLGEAEREIYDQTLQRSAAELFPLLREDDIVYLHDPQTAGLTAALHGKVAKVVWRCHVGLDNPDALARRAWAFLSPYIELADAYVFSREAFVWDNLDREKVWVVPPSIDAFSAKNQDMAPDAVDAILTQTGIAADGGRAPVFVRSDGSRGRVDRIAEVDQEAPLPRDAPLVVQVSRWDRLKGFDALLEAFARHTSSPDAHLLLAGPGVDGVADDPEGAEVLAEIRAQRAQLDQGSRSRVHLACLPMVDRDENAAIVNAVQRRADVIVQNSRAEGFGLTVAEAMWKSRPVVATRIGGIQDQIVDGESGILIDDATDVKALGKAIDMLLAEPDRARAIGEAAHERIKGLFLGTRHLVQYMALLGAALSEPPRTE
jgi:trehalose synthase